MNRYTLVPLMIVIAVLLSITAFADIGNWDYLDRPHKIGKVEEISIAYYNNDQYIYSAVSTEGGILWMSDDAGVSWDTSHYKVDHWHNRVVMKKTDASYGWTLVPSNDGNTDTDAGPYYTTDRGLSWSKRDNGLLDSKKLYALAADQSSSALDTAYVGCEGNDDNDKDLLFKTTNGGTTWFQSQTGLPDTFGTVYDIRISEDNPNYVYCIFEGDTLSGIYQSTNAGANWSKIEITPGSDSLETAMAIGVSDYDPDELFVVEKEPVPVRIWYTIDINKPHLWKQISIRNILLNPACDEIIRFLSMPR